MTPAQLQQASRLVHLVRDNQLELFRPSPKQHAFIGSEAIRAVCRSGNGTGKTRAGAVKAWRWLKANPGKTLLCLCATHKIKVKGVGETLDQTAPRRHLINSDWNKRRGWRNDVIELDNGSSMIFYAAGTGDVGNSISLESINADALWIDEPPPAHLMSAAMSRVRRPTQSQVWMTMTPVGRDVAGVRELVDQGGWEDHNIHMTVEDCPWMTQEDVVLYCEAFLARDYRQRKFGDWEGVTQAQALRSFTEDCINDRVPHLEWNVALGFDHGELAGHEAVGLWIWNTKAKLAWLLDEYESPTETDLAMDVEGVRQMFERNNIPLDGVDLAYGDINSAGKLIAGKVSINKLMGQGLGIRIRPADKRPGTIDYGVRLLTIAFGRGHLRVHSRCAHHIKAFYHWEGTNKGEDKNLKHWVDEARYIGVPMLEQLYDPRTIERLRLGRA